MPYLSVRDVLQRTQDFHRQVREWCDEVDAGADRDAAWVVEYIRHSESSFRAIVDGFCKTSPKAVLDTWVQNVPDREVQAVINRRRVAGPMPIGDVVRSIVEFDAAITALYNHMATTLVPPRVADVFRSLATVQEAMNRDYSRKLLDLVDQGSADPAGRSPIDGEVAEETSE